MVSTPGTPVNPPPVHAGGEYTFPEDAGDCDPEAVVEPATEFTVDNRAGVVGPELPPATIGFSAPDVPVAAEADTSPTPASIGGSTTHTSTSEEPHKLSNMCGRCCAAPSELAYVVSENARLLAEVRCCPAVLRLDGPNRPPAPPRLCAPPADDKEAEDEGEALLSPFAAIDALEDTVRPKRTEMVRRARARCRLRAYSASTYPCCVGKQWGGGHTRNSKSGNGVIIDKECFSVFVIVSVFWFGIFSCFLTLSMSLGLSWLEDTGRSRAALLYYSRKGEGV